ncbi:alpha/beta hydrolase [Mycobacterium sp. 1274761.0]|nr:alpha/beta fold hydrolase [Mycobacterium sp. 1274761.0]OBK76158.1 alpha/beta hydrolase [Mycobacterium sp. 1274761.0]
MTAASSAVAQTLRSAHASRTVTLNGHRIAYRDEGAGEVLLLVHGLNGDSSSWREVIPGLSRKYRVIVPDLLGHGQSDKPRGEYSPAIFAAMLRDLVDALGIDKVTLVGHSLGGGVAMTFAARYRRYCKRLVLLNSGGFGSEVSMLLRMLSLPGAGLVLPFVARGHGRDQRRVFLRTLRSVVTHRGQAASAVDCLHFLAALPIQIIGSERDRIIPVAHAHTAHALLAGSRLHIIPGAGHDPQMHHPDTITELIDDFVAESDAAPDLAEAA